MKPPSPATSAATVQEEIVVSVIADHADAMYRCGEEANFSVTVTKGGAPLTQGDVKVNLSLDGGRTIRNETVPLAPEPAVIPAGTLKEPGFIICKVDLVGGDETCNDYASAAFEPENIRAAGTEPEDFDEFWAAGRAELAAIPMDVQLTPLPEFTDSQQETFKVSFANIYDTRIYGYLSVPKGKKPPYPAFVSVPGAGVGAPVQPITDQAASGALSLFMGVHTHDLGLSDEEYARLRDGELKGYQHSGAPDRNRYFYRRAFLGIDRAVQYLTSRPDWNGKQMVYFGQSQGGGVGLAIVGLNPKFSGAVFSIPSHCDHAGARAGRMPGGPKLAPDVTVENYDDIIRMAAYFDGVNFAKRIHCPVIVAVGFTDPICPPSSVYAAYNVIRGPKRIIPGPHTGHSMPPAFKEFFDPWMDSHLGRREPMPPMAE